MLLHNTERDIYFKSENRRTTMFYQCKMGQNTLEDVVDKFNIRELIEFERYCRDYKLWDEMRPLYHDDAKDRRLLDDRHAG